MEKVQGDGMAWHGMAWQRGAGQVSASIRHVAPSCSEERRRERGKKRRRGEEKRRAREEKSCLEWE